MRHAVYICKVKRELPFPVSLWHFLEVFSLCVCAARGALVNIIFFEISYYAILIKNTI